MVLVLKKGASKQEMKALEEKLEQQSPAYKKMEARKYSGTIRLKSDPLTIQKMLRDEWE